MNVNCENEADCLQAENKSLALFSLGMSVSRVISLLQQWVGALGTRDPLAARGALPQQRKGPMGAKVPLCDSEQLHFSARLMAGDDTPLLRGFEWAAHLHGTGPQAAHPLPDRLVNVRGSVSVPAQPKALGSPPGKSAMGDCTTKRGGNLPSPAPGGHEA